MCAMCRFGFCGLASGAAAQLQPYYVGAGLATTYESNVFRAADDLPASSDTYLTTTLLFGLDQPVKRQRLFADVELRYQAYRVNSQLDHIGGSVALGADWATVESLSGRVSYKREERLADYDTELGATQTELNMRSDQETLLRAQYGGASLWSIEGSLAYQDVKYSQVSYDYAELRQVTLGAVVRYRPSGGLTLGLGLRRTEGTYPLAVGPEDARSEDRFERSDVDALVVWIPTEASTVNLRLTDTRETHQVITSLNVSGYTGALVWGYKPTGKLTIATDFVQDIGSESGGGVAPVGGTLPPGTSQLSKSLALRVQYDVLAKVQTEVLLRRLDRDLASGQGTAASTTGSDTLHEIRLGLNWTPLRSVLAGCSAGQERRTTDTSLSKAYSATVVRCRAQIRLQ